LLIIVYTKRIPKYNFYRFAICTGLFWKMGSCLRHSNINAI
jgi:hypothetical protein